MMKMNVFHQQQVDNKFLPKAMFTYFFSDFHSNYNVDEPSLDFNSINAYQSVKNISKRVTFDDDDDDDDQLDEETNNVIQNNRHKHNPKKWKGEKIY